MSSRRPTFIVRNNNHSAYFFRSILPKDLRQYFNGAREIRISLKTGIRSEALRFSQVLKFQLDKILEDIRYSNNSITCVSSIKEHLRDILNDQLLPKNRGIPKDNGSGPSTFGRNHLLLPPYSIEKMKLPLEKKLVKIWAKKLKHQDILEFCQENDIPFKKDDLPKRNIRQAREKLIDLIDSELDLKTFAKNLAKDILEIHLPALDQPGFKSFISRLEIDEDEIERFSELNEFLVVDDILDFIEAYSNLIQAAMKIGVNGLFPAEKKSTEQNPSKTEETNIPKPEKKADPYEKVWSSLASSPLDKADHQEPEANLGLRESPISIPKNKKKTGPTISTVLDEYLDEMAGGKEWNEKTKLENKTAVEKLIEIIGDLEMESLSFELARKYKRTLAKLPANMNKDKRYRDKSIKEILEEDKAKPQEEKLKPIAINTANNNIAKVVAFMNWTRQNGYVSENYFSGMKLKNTKKARDERKPFSSEDIKKIFNPKTYLAETSLGPARYWVPLLGLYTGARLNELCQIHVADILLIEDGIWCLDINDNKGDPKNLKKLKNLASRRLIPIHPQLLELGFLGYVDRQRKMKSVRLFPELSFGINGYSRKIGHWFNSQHLRKRVGIKDADKSFHSFRHSLTDLLKQKGVGESYLSEYLGHTTPTLSITYERYGKQYHPQVLLTEVVKHIDYGLSLKRLFNPKMQ